ncbi:MAG: bifunctional oligoribonuclease/PAP phosphatase NrnA [Nitrospirota bacterium]|nr:bifunctional oligoribonuclease/PAP phosphatase NrnA [Nitrospirota bacterium]
MKDINKSNVLKVPPELISFLKEGDRFFIATHINPEADALGSALALSMALESLGKETFVYDRDNVPEFYRFLPGYEKFKNSTNGLQPSHFNLILLDCNSLKRAGIEGIRFDYSAVIDHHATEKSTTHGSFGDIRWIEPEAAATGLMVFYLIKDLGVPITREIAINLYAAISIDTGTFRYKNTTSEVLRVGAELIETGVSPAYIAHSLYETWSKERFDLLIMALNTLEIRDDVAIIYASKEMYKKTGANPADTENFPNFPRMMKDIKVSAFFKEIGKNDWKASLRSKGNINVAEIAALFGGGGHENAAGFEIKTDLESAKKSLLKALSKEKIHS